MSVDMTQFVIPKSDQLNADDLIGGPRTITVTAVKANEGSAEQPVSIFFDGDNGKPYKPCKSMRRVMVHVWGADAKNYIGRSMTLYCDPNVQFGGMKVGGIRISHMSHMEKAQTMALTATKSKRAPFTVQPLEGGPNVEDLLEKYAAASTRGEWAALEVKRSEFWAKFNAGAKKRLKDASVAAENRLTVVQVTM